MAKRADLNKTFPNVALLEIKNIADGIAAADAMVKKSPIYMLQSGTVSQGKFIILIGGSTASVDEAYREGLRVAAGSLLDSVQLHDIHPRLMAGIRGEIAAPEGDSLIVFDTARVADVLRISDAVLKGARVNLVELRLADQYGGRGYMLFSGALEEAEAARMIAEELYSQPETAFYSRMIPLLSEEVREDIRNGLRFNATSPVILKDGERPQ